MMLATALYNKMMFITHVDERYYFTMAYLSDVSDVRRFVNWYQAVLRLGLICTY